MKIMITGGKGQLGTDITGLLLQDNDFEVFSYSSQELDITNQKSVFNMCAEVKPDIIIHAAAYTKVDLAEEDADQAFKVNYVGTRNVAQAAELHQAKLIYISTDYVFDGKSEIPYNEFDSTCPTSVYGKSKLAGEEAVKVFSTRFIIVRTSWVYGDNGQNFVKTMLKLALERSEFNVVCDQIGSPTYTLDLAEWIREVMMTELYGTYHVSNSGHCSWYDFAKAIFTESGLDHMKVTPVTTAEFPRPAPRPAYSVMDPMAIRINNLPQMRHWKDALKDFLSINR